MIVHPPRTGCGIVWKNPASGGKKPAIIRITAPVPTANLFTTLVIAQRPMFCEKLVIGEQPNIPASAESKPSQASEPEVSSVVISLSRPPWKSAAESPIVSVADTRNITVIEMIAPSSNLCIPVGSVVGMQQRLLP